MKKGNRKIIIKIENERVVISDHRFKHLMKQDEFKDYTSSELATYIRTGKRKSR